MDAMDDAMVDDMDDNVEFLNYCKINSDACLPRHTVKFALDLVGNNEETHGAIYRFKWDTDFLVHFRLSIISDNLGKYISFRFGCRPESTEIIDDPASLPSQRYAFRDILQPEDKENFLSSLKAQRIRNQDTAGHIWEMVEGQFNESNWKTWLCMSYRFMIYSSTTSFFYGISHLQQRFCKSGQTLEIPINVHNNAEECPNCTCLQLPAVAIIMCEFFMIHIHVRSLVDISIGNIACWLFNHPNVCCFSLELPEQLKQRLIQKYHQCKQLAFVSSFQNQNSYEEIFRILIFNL